MAVLPSVRQNSQCCSLKFSFHDELQNTGITQPHFSRFHFSGMQATTLKWMADGTADCSNCSDVQLWPAGKLTVTSHTPKIILHHKPALCFALHNMLRWSS